MNMKRTAAVGGIFLLAVVLALSACVLMPVEAQDGGSGGGSEPYFDVEVGSKYLDITNGTLNGLNLEKIKGEYPDKTAEKPLNVGIIVPSDVTGLSTKVSDNQVDAYPITSIRFDADSTVSKIPNRAFQNDPYLRYFEMPDSVKTLGNYAFQGSSIEVVVLSPNLTDMGGSTGFAFGYCNDLRAVLVDPNSEQSGCVIPSGITTIPATTFNGCSSLTGTLVLPSNLRTIQSNAFNGCHFSSVVVEGTGQTSGIHFPDSVTTISDQAFINCSSLSGELVLPPNVVSLGKSSFSGCTGITGVVFNEDLENIGTTSSGSVFNGCTGIQYFRTISEDATFELPSNLKVIGRQSFKGCTGLPTDTMVVLPATVEYVGEEAFYSTDRIDTIVVTATDASDYDSEAFKASDFRYGVGERISIFTEYSGWQSFPSSSGSYGDSLTYEFTLYYGNDDTNGEPKLYGQSVNSVKTGEYLWEVNSDYQFPEPDEIDAPTGYQPGGWIYDDKLIKQTTELRPNGVELVLETGLELVRPDVQFIIDGEVVSTDGTKLSVNVSNDRKHEIGVLVSHVIQDVPDADIRVKFEYKWVDIVDSTNGPRTDESGFGRYNMWDNRDVSNTITVNGKDHERTGNDVYRVVIYGYYVPKSGGQWTLFYQSANPIIGVADPDVTHHVTYDFNVVTSDPAVKPEISADDVTVEYGYASDESLLTVVVNEQPGHTYRYQWYGEDGEPIDGANEPTYNPGTGLNAGEYRFSVEVTATKTENNDNQTSSTTLTLNVETAEVKVIPDSDQFKYFGQNDPELSFTVSQDIQLTGKLSREAGESVGTYGITVGTLSSADENYSLTFTEGVIFEIKEYTAALILSPDSPDGSNGWYKSEVTAAPPTGHSISIDDGQTWSDEAVIFEDLDEEVTILLRSELDDETYGAICVVKIDVKVDTVSPTMTGLENNGTYCMEQTFTASDTNLSSVMIDDVAQELSTEGYRLNPGQHMVSVSDEAGNSYTVNVTVNAEHTYGELMVDVEPTCLDEGSGHYVCGVCNFISEVDLDALGHDFGEWEIVEEAGAFEDGYAVRECSRCDAFETMVIPSTGPTIPPYIPDDDWVPVYPGGGDDSTEDDGIYNERPGYPNTGGLTDKELAVLLMTIALILALFAILLLLFAKRRKDEEEEERR